MIHPGIDKVIALLREAGEDEFAMDSICDSACCIGGHCLRALKKLDSYNISGSLSEVAGIHVTDAYQLCWPGWDQGFRIHGYQRITLTDAISVLEHYRDTGTVDWSPVSKRLEREAV